ALVLLPVTGDLQQRHDLLGRLGADAEPVLRTLGVDLDQRGLLGRLVEADLLDRPAVALGARVRDDDAVVRRPDLAESLETDLDGHSCGHSCVSWVSPVRPGGDTGEQGCVDTPGPGRG